MCHKTSNPTRSTQKNKYDNAKTYWHEWNKPKLLYTFLYEIETCENKDLI